MPIRNLLNLVTNRQAPPARIPAGQRVYAVGDIHGRRDLLEQLLATVEEDSARRGPAEILLIFLGDLVDRGPDSRGVVEQLIQYRERQPSTRFLMGNHEEVFLRALEGDLKALRLLIRIGGRETILSYGVSADAYRDLDFEDLAALLRSRVPDDHIQFMSGFERLVEVGDYLFVHAGIRPGVALAEQTGSDLRWIREDFLRHRSSFGPIVVHGHSITDDVDVRPNRIGIDTGAYASGRLTAIGLEGDARWFLSTEPRPA